MYSKKTVLLGLAVTIILLLSSCVPKINIKYPLKAEDISISKKPIPMKIKVLAFADERDAIEIDMASRKSGGYKDLNDYTYDKNFKGNVAEEVSKMLTQHLNYAQVFSQEAEPLPIKSIEISEEQLDSLSNEGVDAVLVGEVKHFYGYYDQNVGRQLLYELPLAVASGLLLSFSTSSGNMTTTFYWYGPGLVLGAYLESLHKRQIEDYVQIDAKLIETQSHEIIWADSIDVSFSGEKSMPGLATGGRKYQVVLNSLRIATNKVVESLLLSFNEGLEIKDLLEQQEIKKEKKDPAKQEEDEDIFDDEL